MVLACSMHAEDIKIEGKTVSWKYNGKNTQHLKQVRVESLEQTQVETNHQKLE